MTGSIVNIYNKMYVYDCIADLRKLSVYSEIYAKDRRIVKSIFYNERIILIMSERFVF